MELAKTHYPSKSGPPAPDARLTRAPLLSGSVKHHSLPSARDAHVAALRVLAVSLLKQIETIEEQDDDATELNLHDQVLQFEATLIRSALEKTGGRQRRAARLLGVKVTTLNTKIKRLRISIDPICIERPPRTLS